MQKYKIRYPGYSIDQSRGSGFVDEAIEMFLGLKMFLEGWEGLSYADMDE